MRSALLALAGVATAASLFPAAASADTLSKEKYLNDEGGVILTCRTPVDKGTLGVYENCGDCEYYALYTPPLAAISRAQPVRGLW